MKSATRCGRVNLAFIVGIVLVLAWPTIAQVMRKETGNVLDANPLVGSGGRNTPVGSHRINSQLYVTGQVTGLGGFRGTTGYYAADQLHLNIPSAGFSTFRRQSVGLADVARGQTYMTNAYLSRSRTVLGVRQITGGLTAPGTNVPITSRVSAAVANKLYSQATEDYKSIMAQRPEQSPLVVQLAVPPVGGSQLHEQQGDVTSRLSTSLLYGSRRSKDKRELARELYELAKKDGRVDDRIDDRIDTHLDTQVESSREVPEQDKDTIEAIKGSRPGSEKTAKPKSESQLPRAGQDVFIDVLVHLGGLKAGSPGEGITIPEVESGNDNVSKTPADETGSKTKDKKKKKQVEFTKDRQLIIHSLAGLGPDLFNKYMKGAEERLGSGRYYRAAEEYKCAAIIDSRNPLPQLGQAIALMVAGEPLSATFHLRHAMVLFPPLMETKLDINAMVLPKDVRREMLRLTERLKETDELDTKKTLLFLAVFLHHNLGHKDRADGYAKSLLKLAGDDKLSSTYATYILTGKRPGKGRPTTQPATGSSK